ncbi:type II secretion system F family protein [Pseudomonas syringae pv. actinidiae]|nr:type II secretion system F family protein [Pseudomonas syringae pv. actinidiae]
MSLKTYAAIIDNGVGPEKITLEAENKSEAIRAATQMGRVIDIKKKSSLILDAKLDIADRQVFLLRMASMLGSRVGTGEALRLMENHFEGPIKRVSMRLRKLVEQGLGLGDAMAKIGHPDFPNSLTALIQAGSSGGSTGEALQNAADFEYEMFQVKKQSFKEVFSAMGGYFSALFLMLSTHWYFGPMVLDSDLMKFAKDKVDVGWAVSMGHWSVITMFTILGFIVVLACLGSVGRMISPNGCDTIISKIPFYKDLIFARNNYTVLYGLSMLVSSGVSIERSLELSSEAAGKGHFHEHLKNAVNSMRNGNPWATELKQLHPTDVAALATAQDRTQTAKALNNISKQYKQLFIQRLQWLAPILQGISTIFLVLSGIVMFGQSVLPVLQFSGASI